MSDTIDYCFVHGCEYRMSTGRCLMEVCVKGEHRMGDGQQDRRTYSFGEAIELVKHGERMCREGWNGKRQYIELATGISYKNTKGEIVNVEHDAIGNAAIAFVGTSGVQLGWLASQADMLAEDWYIVE